MFSRRNLALIPFIGLLLTSLVAVEWRPTKAQDAKAPTNKKAADDAKATKEEPAKPKAEVPENPFPGRVKVPDGILEGGTGWLNTSGPITMKDLRGKIVLLDFWTYCCINCMHVLPDLHYLEKKFPNEIVVIGVHSAKFDNEKDSQNIRNAIKRYEIEHPVINDSKMLVWRKFGTRSWPTLALIDPEGHYLGSQSGEGNRELFESIINKLIAYHKAKGTLDQTPIRFDLERAKERPTPLKYPGKVLADEKSKRLFISDSNHNRIVITSLDGKLIDTIGSGAIGSNDGSYSEASFDHPQGMALARGTLYVADTENHLIRTVDLTKKQVATLAGTGEQDRRRTVGGRLRRTPLNSPWALQFVGNRLFIAMAGPHQMWYYDLAAETIQTYSGSGREDITDGLLPEAAHAQPSGIASDGKAIYVCDSEGSAIRRIDVDLKGKVATIAGPSDLARGASLFEFGDVDSIGPRARFQHPLGIAYHDGSLYVADTYNHKIKKLTRNAESEWESDSWLGTGDSGNKLEPVQFSEPSGLTVAKGKLYIADTNNHRILVADLETKKVSPLAVAGLKPPVSTAPEDIDVATTNRKKFIGLAEQTVGTGDALNIQVTLDLPEGFKINKLFPSTYRITSDGNQQLVDATIFTKRSRAVIDGQTAALSIPLEAKTGRARFLLALTYGYCRDGVGGLCKLRTVRWNLPVHVTADAKQKIVQLQVPAEKPKTQPTESPKKK